MRRYRAEMVAGLLLVTLTLCALGRVCGHDFVNFDDPDYVTHNPQVQAGLTRGGVAWAFTTTHAANWHPLTWLSLELDHQLYGTDAWGYHLTNLLLHTANTLLLFLALRRMTGAVGRSALVAALFAVHPLHVESVAWVSERKDVLSGLFWMLALLAYAWYAERPAWGRYLLVLAAFALGLMAKPMLVTLPCVLLLLDYWPLNRLSIESSIVNRQSAIVNWKWLLAEKVPLFALSAGSCVVTLFAQRQAIMPVAHLPILLRVANALTAYASYVGKMFWPLRLAIGYPYPHSLSLLGVLAAGTLFLVVSHLALRTARRRPYLLVGWLWFLGTLVPVIGLVQVGKQPMADRYTYIPLIGLFVSLVWAVADLVPSWPRRRTVLVALSALVLLPCLVLTWRQAGTWRDTESLWNHALDVTTDNSDAHINVGWVLEQQGRPAGAIGHYRQALAIAPGDPVAHFSLAAALEKEGQTEEAVRNYRATLAGDPRHAQAHNNLGAALARQGRLSEAATHLVTALEINPDSSQAHNNLGGVLAREGKPAEAVNQFTAALRLDPENALAHCNLGVALQRLGRKEEALNEYRAALRIQPGSAAARQGLEALLDEEDRP